MQHVHATVYTRPVACYSIHPLRPIPFYDPDVHQQSSLCCVASIRLQVVYIWTKALSEGGSNEQALLKRERPSG